MKYTFFFYRLKYVLIPFYVIGVVYASVMYDVTVGVDIGIRYPAQKDDTTHKLIGRLKSPAYLIASLFFFSCGMQYNNDNELNFLKDLFFRCNHLILFLMFIWLIKCNVIYLVPALHH